MSVKLIYCMGNSFDIYQMHRVRASSSTGKIHKIVCDRHLARLSYEWETLNEKVISDTCDFCEMEKGPYGTHRDPHEALHLKQQFLYPSPEIKEPIKQKEEVEHNPHPYRSKRGISFKARLSR